MSYSSNGNGTFLKIRKILTVDLHSSRFAVSFHTSYSNGVIEGEVIISKKQSRHRLLFHPDVKLRLHFWCFKLSPYRVLFLCVTEVESSSESLQARLRSWQTTSNTTKYRGKLTLFSKEIVLIFSFETKPLRFYADLYITDLISNRWSHVFRSHKSSLVHVSNRQCR